MEHAMSDRRRTTPPTRPRGPETPAARVRRLVEEACNQGRLGILEEVLPSRHPADGADGGEPPAWAHLPDLLAAFRDAVPDARWTIVAQTSEGETVVTRLRVAGSFSGPLLGLAPPGRPATLTGVAISRFAGVRLVDLWLQADLLGLLEQLGVLPPLGLTQVAAMARVVRAGALLADEPAAAPPRSPPRTPAGAAAADPDHPASLSRRAAGRPAFDPSSDK
jgi:predicted ester cyclase